MYVFGDFPCLLHSQQENIRSNSALTDVFKILPNICDEAFLRIKAINHNRKKKLNHICLIGSKYVWSISWWQFLIYFDVSFRRLQYFDEDRNIFRFSVNNIPEDLSRKVTLLNYFSNYMDKHLLKVPSVILNFAQTFSDLLSDNSKDTRTASL